MSLHFADDPDGAALKKLVLSGSDLARPMDIDFFVVLPDESSARTLTEAATPYGFRVDVSPDSEGEVWECTCTKSMVPDHLDVVASQKLLENLSHPLGGHTQGWGSLGNHT